MLPPGSNGELSDRAVVIRGRKFTSGFPSRSHGGQTGFPGVTKMPARDQEMRKNYIGILNDTVEEQRVLEATPISHRRFKDYFLGLMARILKR